MNYIIKVKKSFVYIINILNKKPLLALFITFFLTLLLKCLLFAYYTMDYDLILNPLIFENNMWRFYLMYIVVCGIIASLMLIFKNKLWIIISSVILDIWLLSNLVYWRSYHNLLNVWCLETLNSLNGFWDAIIIFLEWKDCLFPCLTILLILIYITLPKLNYRKLLSFAICFIIFFFSTAPKIGSEARMYHVSKNIFNNAYNETWISNYEYCSYFSPITYLFFQLKTLIVNLNEEKPQIEEQELIPFMHKDEILTANNSNKYNLIVVCFESLETWTINEQIENQYITPNINRLLSSSHSLFSDKVKVQTMGGSSSDAQILINTGLLPINKGAVILRYPLNYYYSIPKTIKEYTKQMWIVDDGTTWNYKIMPISFSYDTIFVNNISDLFMCKRISENIPVSPYMLQVVTIASHSPFLKCADSSSIVLSNDIPTVMRNYIKCVNYTDKALGLLFNSVNLDSTIILITGDHTIFSSEKREKFTEYCQNNNLTLPVEKAFVPLIIYSPEIKEQIIIKDTVYQMDIYPTLLHLLHKEDYVWKGFGINLLDIEAKREILPEDASRLSDEIILNDYFQKYKN